MNLPQVYMCSQSSPYHPSGSSQCTSPKHPISCIKPGLAIHFLYDIIHISMLFSQIIPPLHLPQSPKDCSIHLCLFCCLAHKVIITIFLNSIYICVSILYWCFSFWLTSLCIIGSSFITQRDGIGGSSGWGNTCTPVADAGVCTASPLGELPLGS